MEPSRCPSTAPVLLIAGALLATALAGCANGPGTVQGVRAAALLPPSTPGAVTATEPPVNTDGETGIVPVATPDQPPKQGKDSTGKPAEASGPQDKESK